MMPMGIMDGMDMMDSVDACVVFFAPSRKPQAIYECSGGGALVDDGSPNLLDTEEKAVEIAFLVADKDVEFAAGGCRTASAQLAFQGRLSLAEKVIDLGDGLRVGFDMDCKPFHLAR